MPGTSCRPALADHALASTTPKAQSVALAPILRCCCCWSLPIPSVVSGWLAGTCWCGGVCACLHDQCSESWPSLFHLFPVLTAEPKISLSLPVTTIYSPRQRYRRLWLSVSCLHRFASAELLLAARGPLPLWAYFYRPPYPGIPPSRHLTIQRPCTLVRPTIESNPIEPPSSSILGNQPRATATSRNTASSPPHPHISIGRRQLFFSSSFFPSRLFCLPTVLCRLSKRLGLQVTRRTDFNKQAFACLVRLARASDSKAPLQVIANRSTTMGL